MEKQEFTVKHKNFTQKNKEMAFTTLKFSKGKIAFLRDHLERLERSSQELFGEGIPKQEMVSTLSRLKGDLKVKIKVFKEEQVNFHVMTGPLENDGEKKKLGIRSQSPRKYPDFVKYREYEEVSHILKNLKQEGLNDFITFDKHKRLCEASVSNVFLIKDGKVITPSPNQTFLNGLARKQLISFLHQEGVEVKERVVFQDEIWDFEEMFLTNAVRGIQLVSNILNRKLGDSVSREIQVLFTNHLWRKSETVKNKMPPM